MWLAETVLDPSIGDGLPAEKRATTLNSRLLDISKRRVEAVFTEVFGYGLMLEPTKHRGQCVEKSNLNGLHDGRLIQCPVAEVNPQKVYQKIVDNRSGSGRVMDIRIPIILNDIPFVYLKYRPMRSRFSNQNASVAVENVENVLSVAEISKVKRFGERVGLDLGEIDLLRDVTNGKIYIIDVNNTPYGPPNHLAVGESLRAIRLYSDMLRRKIQGETG
jgi:hypothetical protein